MGKSASTTPRRSGFHVMTKPIGPMCNLDCTYCYYLEKENLYPPDEQFRMSEEVLEDYVRQYIASQDAPEVVFAWQGGEPTLLGVDFFRKAVGFQQKYAAGKRVSNALQTNGTLLDDEWGPFLAEHQFLIGLSVDGPAELHDAYRVDKRGRPTFDQVMRGLEVLKRHGVEFNTLTVVNRKNSQDPLAVYRFLKDIGSGFIRFIPLVERTADANARRIGLDLALPPDPEAESPSPVTPWSVESKPVREFLRHHLRRVGAAGRRRGFRATLRHRPGQVGRIFGHLVCSPRPAAMPWSWNTMATCCLRPLRLPAVQTREHGRDAAG